MNMNNMQEQLKQLQSNPREFIQRAGLNVPEEMLNNPKQMVMHLINTNQVGGDRLQQIMQMVRQMGMKI